MMHHALAPPLDLLLFLCSVLFCSAYESSAYVMRQPPQSLTVNAINLSRSCFSPQGLTKIFQSPAYPLPARERGEND